MRQGMQAESPPAAGLDSAAELRIAWILAGLVLMTLLAVKPLGGIPYIGALGFTLAAGLQLYMPIWRAEKHGLDYDAIGLHLHAWRQDLKNVAWLCLLTYPPFALGHHLYVTAGAQWAAHLGLDALQPYIPQMALGPRWPQGAGEWFAATAWLLELTAVNMLGVALPEETFYRGYLQPRLQQQWPTSRRIAGVPLGRAAVVTAALFALGHFLGEWNPLRWGPFFPALLFAWLRNATGSIAGAVFFHGLCNVFGRLLFALYQPI